ncbi:MAG TPA: alpha/beta fold hydrolase [Gemmatimonadales bacterium]|nr:alpha/beta fold hydrolase [Gemmatimonadales bacterium]
MTIALRLIATATAHMSIMLPGVVAAQTVPRLLDAVECPLRHEEWAAGVNVECRWLVVPQFRNSQDTAQMRLFVVVLRAARPTGKPPLVMLHGGPGESALLPMVRWGRGQGTLVRDIVVYDQRGAGLSEPDPCPGYAARLRDPPAIDGADTGSRGVLRALARECVSTMRARGLDPAAYSTTENVADLLDLRVALGYDRWDLYGVSYGARLALEAMRRDPNGIRAVTLDRPVPPGAVEAEAPLATQRALARVLAACNRNVECRTTYPELEQTLLEVYDTLSRAPVAVPATDGSSRQIVVDGASFVNALRQLLRSREGVAFLPLLLHELRNGDRTRAAGQLTSFGGAGRGRAGRATFWLVQCYDQYGATYTADLAAARSMVSRPLSRLADNLQECPIWQERSAKPTEGAPLLSEIPTLVLTGEFDARTPVEFGRRIAANLPHSYLFELPGETHSPARPSACRAAIIAEFANDPRRRPAAACIAQMPPVAFLTSWP